MTVAELIVLLSKEDPKRVVLVETNHSGECHIDSCFTSERSKLMAGTDYMKNEYIHSQKGFPNFDALILIIDETNKFDTEPF
jgi:hypothetical protein